MSHPAAHSVVEENKPRHNGWRVVSIILAVVLTTIAMIQVSTFAKEAYHDHQAYRNWPAAGTESSPDGKPLFANALVALTCRNGKAHLEEKMLVNTRSKSGKKIQPSWYMALYVEYDQSRSQECTVYYSPYTEDVSVKVIELQDSRKEWAMTFGWSFNNLSKMSAGNNGGIALLLVTIGSLPQGPEIKNSQNGIPAPSRDLLS